MQTGAGMEPQGWGPPLLQVNCQGRTGVPPGGWKCGSHPGWGTGGSVCPLGAFRSSAESAGCQYRCDLRWGRPWRSKPEHCTLPFPLQPFPQPSEAHADRTSAAWRKQSKWDCLITCSQPFAGLVGLMGKKRCIVFSQGRSWALMPAGELVLCIIMPAAVAATEGCCQARPSRLLWSQAEAELLPLRAQLHKPCLLQLGFGVGLRPAGGLPSWWCARESR